MENHLYTCQFCQENFKPTRRKTQKFCSATCRSKNHHHKNKEGAKTSIEKLTDAFEKQENKKTEIEKMSFSGIGNAALGNLAVNTATAIAKEMFIPNEKKPATKGDIQELKNLINTRFFFVHNMNSDSFGRKAYFDISTGNVVYLNQ